MTKYSNLFEKISNIKVGVVGDLMLDTYMWGKTERISPEAPVPIVTLHHKEYRIGGAGNVALNCRSLDARVSIFSVTGNDEAIETLERLFSEKDIDTSGIVKSNERSTTSKTRIISRNQQMMRLDDEITTDLIAKDEDALVGKIEAYIKNSKPDVIIFEDYNKGVLTASLITRVLDLCKRAGILTAVDPKRKNFFEFREVDIFKPNLKEVKDGLNLLFDEVDVELLKRIHAELKRIIGHRMSFITLSEKGVFYQENEQARIIPSHLRNIADVSGAGDTVIAVASLTYAASKDIDLAAEVANIAGGLVCEEVGTVAINKEKLLIECNQLLP